MTAKLPDNSQPVKRPRKRPSKRFLWQEELHHRFVAAIFDLGLKTATPKALLSLMKAASPDAELMTEHLKSHLQKYRLKYERSRHEFKELCQREAKRSRKRQRRLDRLQLSSNRYQSKHQGANEDEESVSAATIVVDKFQPFGTNQELAVAQLSDSYMSRQPASAIPELTDAQCRMYSMTASPSDFNSQSDFGSLSIQVPQDGILVEPRVQEELRSQMYQAMLAQMSFHRQMLTRKVELSHILGRSTGVENWEADTSNYGTYCPQETSFQHKWTSSRQLQPPEQPLAAVGPQTLVNSSLLSIPVQPEELLPRDAKSDAVGDDLSRWDPFNVGLENDDLFDFLKA